MEVILHKGPAHDSKPNNWVPLIRVMVNPLRVVSAKKETLLRSSLGGAGFWFVTGWAD